MKIATLLAANLKLLGTYLKFLEAHLKLKKAFDRLFRRNPFDVIKDPNGYFFNAEYRK